jgi:hypothetical protein
LYRFTLIRWFFIKVINYPYLIGTGLEEALVSTTVVSGAGGGGGGAGSSLITASSPASVDSVSPQLIAIVDTHKMNKAVRNKENFFMICFMFLLCKIYSFKKKPPGNIISKMMPAYTARMGSYKLPFFNWYRS